MMQEGSVLPSELHLLPKSPGVYFFIGAKEHILYIGKATSLIKRVSQYFQKGNHNQKTLAMLQAVVGIRYICTTSAHAALVLENQKIKQHQPKYNILLKDDKTFPYVMVSKHAFPSVYVSRGKRGAAGTYLGPFTNVRDLRWLMEDVQKTFQVRTCTDNYFKHRSRPCMLHQINRCTAPCVGYVTQEAYARQVTDMVDLFQGRSTDVIDRYVRAMQQASEDCDFEKAAYFRDAVASIQRLRGQALQKVYADSLDVVCSKPCMGGTLIQISFVRDHTLQDSRSYVIDETVDCEMQVLAHFLYRYYQQTSLAYGVPKRLLVPDLSEEKESWNMLFRELGIHCQLKITAKWQGLYDTTLSNLQARDAQYQRDKNKYTPVFDYLEALFQESDWRSIECVDISHTMGEQTYASCVRLEKSGLAKNAYRAYKLDTGADDYASMRSLAKRRYGKLDASGNLPSMLLIDGGKSQLKAVQDTLSDQGLFTLPLVAITKDSQRRSGNERYFVAKPYAKTVEQVDFPPTVRRAMEWIRDEAHRFAISKHRRSRQKQSTRSELLNVEGIGPKRHEALITHFGGWSGLVQASLAQLEQVPGISRELAKKIHDTVKDN